MIDLCLTETDFQLIKRTWLFANFTTEREKISIIWFFHVTARNATPKNIFKSSKKFMFSQKVQSQLSPLIQLLFFVLIINNKMLPFSLCMKQFTSCFPLYIKIWFQSLPYQLLWGWFLWCSFTATKPKKMCSDHFPFYGSWENYLNSLMRVTTVFKWPILRGITKPPPLKNARVKTNLV